MKNETLKITYSYWDGQGHRRIAMVKKGDTVKDFLQKVKEQLIPEFRELRCVHCAAGALQPFGRLVSSSTAAHARSYAAQLDSLQALFSSGWDVH